MTELPIYKGFPESWDLQCKSRVDGADLADLLDTDVPSAQVWGGQDQAVLFSPAASFTQLAIFGQITVSPTAAQSATLEANGEYLLIVYITRSGVMWPVWEGRVKVLPTPGTATRITPVYCTYQDMLRYAPWISGIQDMDTDQEGFYSQRLEATNWLNWLIIKSYRGTGSTYFGDQGRSAQFWTGAWARRSAAPSQWLINQLSGGTVLPTITVTAAGSGYTFATIAFSGGGATPAGQASASATISGGQIISISLISSGYGYTSVPTITITGDGTGATATCTISQTTLILRPNIVRTVAKYAVGIVARSEIGGSEQLSIRGTMFEHIAESEANSITAELDTNGDGIADLNVSLGATNTLFT